MKSLSIGTSQLFPTSSRRAGQTCQCTKELWRFAHCTAVTTCLAAFPGRKLPTRQGLQREVFHCLEASKSSIQHPAISLQESSSYPSPASPRPMASRPVTFLFDPQPPPPLPCTYTLRRREEVHTSLRAMWYHVGFFFWSHLNFGGLIINDEWRETKDVETLIQETKGETLGFIYVSFIQHMCFEPLQVLNRQ